MDIISLFMIYSTKLLVTQTSMNGEWIRKYVKAAAMASFDIGLRTLHLPGGNEEYDKYTIRQQAVYHPKVPARYILNTGHNYICLSQFTQQITIQQTDRRHSTNNFCKLDTLPSNSGIMITSWRFRKQQHGTLPLSKPPAYYNNRTLYHML